MNWPKITETIKYELSEIFATNTPTYTDLDDATELVRKVIYYLTQDRNLNGLSKTLPEAIQNALIDRVGDMNDVFTIAEKLEPFLKKIAIIGGKGTAASVRNLTLMPLIKLLGINHALSAPAGTPGANPLLSEITLPSYKGTADYLEYICLAYLTRNAVHEAPVWRRPELANRLNAVMAVYLYAALCYKTEIDQLPDNRPGDEVNLNKVKPEEKYLYYFMSFGDTTNRIKNQIVTAYVLQFLKENGMVTIDQLKTAVDTFFRNPMELAYYNSLVPTLQQDGKILYDRDTKNIELRPEELDRIVKTQQNFDDERNIFFMYLEDLCNHFNIKAQVNDVFDHLYTFFENNYQIDIDEASSRGAQTKKDEDQSYKDLIAYLITLTSDKDVAHKLFTELISLSKTSDFLLKIAASRVFAKISNPDRFEHYIREHNRILYLDTQIILFALCLNYTKKDFHYDNSFFQTTSDLFNLLKNDKSIIIRIPKHYIQEAAYHLKLAVMLIPFEQYGGEHLSGNIFYRFYHFLKKADLLHRDDKSYAQFIKNVFFLEEADAYNHKYQDIAVKIIDETLTTAYPEVEIVNIGVHTAGAFEVIDEVLKENGHTGKSPFVIANDAKMLNYLTERDSHEVEPFFLTWDKRWQDYRKKYLDQYLRMDAVSFHLFNPAKFINHHSLLKLKINPQAITNDLLSLMATYTSNANTDTVWDVANKFTGIENIDQETRHRYISFVVNVFRNELNYSTDDIDSHERSERITAQFEDAVSKIHEHFYEENSEFKLDDFRQVMLYQENFKKIVTLVTQNIANTLSTKELLYNVDGIIREYKVTKTK